MHRTVFGPLLLLLSSRNASQFLERFARGMDNFGGRLESLVRVDPHQIVDDFAERGGNVGSDRTKLSDIRVAAELFAFAAILCRRVRR